ncbi:hypothetical protein CSUB01_10521 [Colletotrichum sublineola]|uniref:Uncharacterized protein n=1 Tax=Colletotrichum sublineola TaxID=1173701 RepID=A0A066XJD9_COLSU|nr:hypothetical protein CSUB01_10521 [Colletotrichum sublineola]
MHLGVLFAQASPSNFTTTHPNMASQPCHAPSLSLSVYASIICRTSSLVRPPHRRKLRPPDPSSMGRRPTRTEMGRMDGKEKNGLTFSKTSPCELASKPRPPARPSAASHPLHCSKLPHVQVPSWPVKISNTAAALTVFFPDFFNCRGTLDIGRVMRVRQNPPMAPFDRLSVHLRSA